MECLFKSKKKGRQTPSIKNSSETRDSFAYTVAMAAEEAGRAKRRDPGHRHKWRSRRLFASIIGSLIITSFSSWAAVWISFSAMPFQGFVQINGLQMTLAEDQISWQPGSLLSQRRNGQISKESRSNGSDFSSGRLNASGRGDRNADGFGARPRLFAALDPAAGR